MPARNLYFVYDGQLAPWVPPDPLPSARVELKPVGRYLAELDARAPDLGLRFLITDQPSGPLPMSGADLVVVCVKDELAARPGYADQVGMVFKCYGTDRPFFAVGRHGGLGGRTMALASEGLVQLHRATRWLQLARAPRPHGRPPVTDLPLGCLVEPAPTVSPIGHRSLDLAFMGSLEASGARRRPPSVKSGGRARLVSALRSIEAAGEWTVHLSTTSTYFQSQGHHAAYQTILADTKLLPCPRGNSLETYRWFEAFAFGCIPVVADPLPNRSYYRGAPAVRVEAWSELRKVTGELLQNRSRMEELQEAGQEWWRSRCCPAAVAERMIEIVKAENQGLLTL
ncbi:MAG: glycosyltransferase [Acidimicrobiales bacterium]|nr:glycosyltransferase [Acidimicrobiales bacterium]